jgi:hypothetical protein
VYTRVHEGDTLTFIVSGKLWRNSLVMQDRETSSLWSHVTGEALGGDMTGAWLEMVPSVQTTWERWFREHPSTRVLRKDRTVTESRYARYMSDSERMGIFRADYLRERLPGKSIVHGVVRGTHSLAVTDARLADGTLLNVPVGDDPVVFIALDDGGVRAYVARAGAQELRFILDEKSGAIRDAETGSSWDLARGVCIKGELAGATLEEIVVRLAYWFAWSGFYPRTEIID